MNHDPSRDVLQHLLNPYEGLEFDDERVQHPFNIKKASKASNRRKKSQMVEE